MHASGVRNQDIEALAEFLHVNLLVDGQEIYIA